MEKEAKMNIRILMIPLMNLLEQIKLIKGDRQELGQFAVGCLLGVGVRKVSQIMETGRNLDPTRENI